MSDYAEYLEKRMIELGELLSAAPKPAPDVAHLVQALENVLKVTRGSSGRIILDEADEQDLRAALAAHRQQEQSHER
jgi:hypothetical protein